MDYTEGMTAHKARMGGLSVPGEVVDIATLERHDCGSWAWFWTDYNGQRVCWVDVEVAE